MNASNDALVLTRPGVPGKAGKGKGEEDKALSPSFAKNWEPNMLSDMVFNKHHRIYPISKY